MSLTGTFSANDDPLFAETGVIIVDVPPRSTEAPDQSCSCCPTLSAWCIKDPLGLTCVCLTWLFFLYGEFVVVWIVFLPNNYSSLCTSMNLLVFHALMCLAISSQARTMLSDPGAVPLNSATLENVRRYEKGATIHRCTRCHCIKPPRAHHCSVCNRCIQGMDHHCVFVNNCVGQGNQKSFLLFTFYTLALSVYAMILLYVHIRKCVQSDWTACLNWSPPLTILCVITLSLLALCFALFTATITGIQLYAIYTDTTGIESFKGRSASDQTRQSFLSSLKTVFGSRIGLAWLNPYAKPVHVHTQDDERVSCSI